MKNKSSLPATSYQLQAKKGFTLIEVLIVVGIIGLLASVVLSGLGSVRSRGRDARRAADLRQVQQGLELYYTREQRYPSEVDASTWLELEEELKSKNIGITGISDDPLCGSGGSCDDNYQYFSTNGEEYVLQALLEDKESPLAKDSFDESFGGSKCGTPRGDRFYYCVKF